MKTFFAAAGLAAVLAAGSAQAGGHVNWSIGINLPPVGALISGGPQYRSYDVPAYYGPGYGAVVLPAPVYAPPPVVVYRPVPPPVFYPRPLAYGGYAPVPIAYGSRWHDRRGWRDDRWSDRGHGGDDRGGRWNDRGDDRDGRWAPVPRDERRQRH